MDYDYETEMEDADFDAVIFPYMKKQKESVSNTGTVYTGQRSRSGKGYAASADDCKRKTESSPEKSTEDLLSTAKGAIIMIVAIVIIVIVVFAGN